MKPNPFLESNHFTVPVGMFFSTKTMCDGGRLRLELGG
jgi:hypothetical protein